MNDKLWFYLPGSNKRWQWREGDGERIMGILTRVCVAAIVVVVVVWAAHATPDVGVIVTHSGPVTWIAGY